MWGCGLDSCKRYTKPKCVIPAIVPVMAFSTAAGNPKSFFNKLSISAETATNFSCDKLI
jgi:hypothetical protein